MYSVRVYGACLVTISCICAGCTRDTHKVIGIGGCFLRRKRCIVEQKVPCVLPIIGEQTLIANDVTAIGSCGTMRIHEIEGIHCPAIRGLVGTFPFMAVIKRSIGGRVERNGRYFIVDLHLPSSGTVHTRGTIGAGKAAEVGVKGVFSLRRNTIC